jgi:hypothetical protein
MRGKTLMWMLVAAIIVCSGFVTTNVASASTAHVYITPANSSVTDFDPMNPPVIDLQIMIDDVEDLFAWGLRLTWDFDLLYCDVLEVEKGGFLTGPLGTAFAKTLNLADRYLDMGETIIGAYPGVDGSGCLATVALSVRELGACDLDLFGIMLLDSNLNEIPYTETDGYFESLASSAFAANLVQKRLKTHCMQIPSPTNPTPI